MLKPKYLEQLPNRMIELYSQVEMDIIAEMALRLLNMDFIPSVEWRYKKLIEMGNFHSWIMEALSAQTGFTRAEIERLMEEAGVKALQLDSAAYRKAGLNPPTLATSPNMQAVLRAGIENTGGLFNNLTRTTADTATKQFEDALDRAWMQITSGAFDRNSAIKMAVKDLADKGIAAITYPSGHRDYLDVAVRRAVVTGVNQTSLKLGDSLGAEMDCNLWDVTAHAGARSKGTGAENHAQWQGKRYAHPNPDPKYPSLVEATGYGTGEGLGGWGCRHNKFPAFEGMEPLYTQEELAELNAPKYEYNGRKLTEEEAQDRQRAIERNIRKWKREYVGMEAAGQPTDEAAAKIAKWNAEQKDFLEQTGMKRQADREAISGFDRSQASKATWSARKINNPTDFPDEAFARTITANSVADPGFEQILTKRFASGNETAKKVFAKYVPGKSVVDGTYGGPAHYSPATKRISMNYLQDAANVRGPGATYFHEHGHLIDFAAGSGVPVSSASKAFKEALQNDYKGFIINYKRSKGLPDYTQTYAAISDDLKTSDMLSAVSDILGGISDGNIVGKWGHASSYWRRNPDRVMTESFAHLFEAQFSKERLRIFSEYFPTAAEEFKKILGGLL